MGPLPLPRRWPIAIAVTTAAVAGVAHQPASTPAPTELRVHAGSVSRQQTLVPVSSPALRRGQYYQLDDATGAMLILQIDRNGHGWFVLPALEAGAERVYAIGLRGGGVAQVATAATDGDEINVAIGGRKVLTYIGGGGRLPSPDIKPQYQRGGYIHPVRSPSGHIVTDDYPADHRHQHGIMFAWTNAEFEGRKTDFWNMGDAKGRVEAVTIDRVESGGIFASWTARHRYVDLTSGAAKPALDELWQTRVYAVDAASPPYFVFDVDVQQKPATAVPLVLPEYHYGGMALRGAASFIGAPTNEIVLTSEGKDRASADNTRERWAHISGRIDGAIVGIAMLAHPDNFRAPEPLRVHPTDPYICFAPSRLGAWSITAERPHTARYRFVAADGPANSALLDRLWRDYADPPKVTIK